MNPRPTDPLNDAKAQLMLRKWNEAQAPYRACDLCSHLRLEVIGGAKRCQGEGKNPIPVSEARALGGHCGPEAVRLDIPSWRAPKASPFDPHTASGFK